MRVEVKYAPEIQVSSSALAWLAGHDVERKLVERFVGLMVEELAANNGKGNRPGWLEMDRKEALAEVHWHASKLSVAAKQLEQGGIHYTDDVEHGEGPKERVREYAADVANCALTVLDCMGLLRASSKEVGGDGE